MELGFTLPNNWGIDDIGGVVALAAQAEAAGYTSVWVKHHVLNVGYVGERLGDGPYHDALTVLTAAATSTEQVRLGTSVLVLPYLHPMVLAKQLATLDQLSGGRVVAGVGVGSLPEENAALGVGYDDRGRYSDESIEVMRQLWSHHPPSFSGAYFDLDGQVASPKPAQDHLPLYVGGNRPPALRRVAAIADGWHPLGPSPEGLVERLERLDAELDQRGRSRSDIVVSVRLDVGRARKASEEYVELFGAYGEAGADELVLSISSPDLDLQRSTLERLAAEVLPSLTQ